MKMPEIDAYIAEFEKLVRKANYTLGSPEMNQHFIVGLPQFITEDVLKDPEPTTYPEILRNTLASICATQTIWALYKRGNQAFNNSPQYNSSYAPHWMQNTAVPMDLSRTRAPNCRRGGRGTFRGRSQYGQYNNQPTNRFQNNATTTGNSSNACFQCGQVGH